MIPISVYQILIPLILVAMQLLLRRRFRTIFNPVSITVMWWGFWLWLATFGLTGVFPPNEDVIWITFTMLGGMMAGAFICVRPHTGNYPRDSTAVTGERFFRNFSKAYPWLFGFALVLVLPVFFRALYGIAKFGPNNYRGEAFADTVNAGWLFKSTVLESLYFIISGPLLLGIFLIGMALFLMTGQRRVLAAGIALSLLDGILRLGRINIYMVCLLGVIGMSIMYGMRKSDPTLVARLNRKVRYGVAVLAVLFCVSAWMSVYRSEKVMRNLADQFEVFVVDYHTVGFALLGEELKKEQSSLRNTLTYGRLTFGGLESLVAVVVRRFDRGYLPPALANMAWMSESQVVGFELDTVEKTPKTYNAYYTILYSLYSDGRYVGLFLGGLGLGYLMAFSYAWWRGRGELEPLVWILFLLSVGILGIFVSTLENMRTWVVALGLVGLRVLPASGRECGEK